MEKTKGVTLDTAHSDINHLFQLLDTINDVLMEMPYERDGKRDTDLDRVASLNRIALERAERLLSDMDNNYAEIAAGREARS